MNVVMLFVVVSLWTSLVAARIWMRCVLRAPDSESDSRWSGRPRLGQRSPSYNLVLVDGRRYEGVTLCGGDATDPVEEVQGLLVFRMAPDTRVFVRPAAVRSIEEVAAA